MRDNLIKILFSFVLSATVFALPNEIEESSFNQFFESKLDVFCSPENSNEPFKDLVSNLYVFTCSSKKDSENFCQCINKIEKNITNEDADKITKRIQKEIIEEHARQEFELDRSNNTVISLENMFHLMDLQPNLATGNCINPKNHIGTKDPIAKDLLRREELYFASKTLGSQELADREFDLTEIIYAAESAYMRSLSLDYSYNIVDDDKNLDDLINDVIIEKYDENNGFLFKTDFENSNQRHCGNMTEEYTNTFKGLIKEYIREKNSQHGLTSSSSSMRDTMGSALQRLIRRECKKIEENVIEEFSKKNLGKEKYKSYLRNGKRIFFDAKGLAKNGHDKSLIEVIKTTRDKKLSEDPDKEEIKVLEEKFYYDVAYCHILEKYEATENEVAEIVEKDGEEIATQMQELVESEEAAEKLSGNVELMDEDISILKEKIETEDNIKAKTVMAKELAVLRANKSTAERLLAQNNVKTETIRRSLEEKLNGEEQLMVYRSATTINTRSLRRPLSRVGNKTKIDNEPEMEDRISRFMNAEKERLSKNKIFNAHDKASKDKILESVKKEQEELLEMNSAFSSGDPKKISKMLEDETGEMIKKNTTPGEIEAQSKKIQAELAGKSNLPGTSPLGNSALNPSNLGKLGSNGASSRVNRPYSTLDRVVKNLSPKPTSNPLDRKVDEVITELAQRKDNSELTNKAKEVKEKSEDFKNALAPLQASLDDVLEKVDKESKEIEAIRESVSKQSQIKSEQTAKQLSKAPKQKPKKKNRIVRPIEQKRTSQVSRSVTPKTIQSSNSESPISTSQAVDYSPQPRISLFSTSPNQDVSAIKSSLKEGTKVITLSEFSKMSDKNLNVKNLEGVDKTFILDNGDEEVLVKTIYENDKPVRFEIVGSASKTDLAKSLVEDKIELNKSKMELYNYDEFMKLIRKSQK